MSSVSRNEDWRAQDIEEGSDKYSGVGFTNMKMPCNRAFTVRLKIIIRPKNVTKTCYQNWTVPNLRIIL